jgi:uncharacterized protein with FMN-binding domain
MKRVALAIVSTIATLVMLLSFKTHAAAPATTPPAAVSTTGSSSSGSSSSGSSATSTAVGTGTKTVTGDSVNTRFGAVQVRVTVTNGKITAASAIDYPTSNPRDAQINAYAIPTLNSEAVQAGTANIDMVSGATFTSEGYLQSLQSALNKV